MYRQSARHDLERICLPIELIRVAGLKCLLFACCVATIAMANGRVVLLVLLALREQMGDHLGTAAANFKLRGATVLVAHEVLANIAIFCEDLAVNEDFVLHREASFNATMDIQTNNGSNDEGKDGGGQRRCHCFESMLQLQLC